MKLRDLIGRLIPARSPAKPKGSMDRFEVTGLHELSSTIELRRDTAANLMVLFFAALTVFIAASMWLGTFSKQETMRGIVIGSKGGQRITSIVGGTVSKIWVKQGQSVKAGQRLITVIPQQTSAGAGSLSRSDLLSLTEQKANSEGQMSEIQAAMSDDAKDLDAFERNLLDLAANLKGQERELQKAAAAQEETVNKMRSYLKRGYTTRESVTAQERAWQEYNQQLASVRMQMTQLASTRIEQRRTVQQNYNANVSRLAELDRMVSELDARIQRAKSAIATDIISVADGQVAAINVREGSEVLVGDTIAAIGNPEAPFTIGLQAPSKTMGLLTIGQTVVLKYDAYPYKTFGVKRGRIIAISSQPVTLPKEDEQQMALMNPALAKSAEANPPQSKFLVEVEPEDKTINAYGEERQILIGSTLSADVIVEHRRLIDWVLDPIHAMRGRT